MKFNELIDQLNHYKYEIMEMIITRFLVIHKLLVLFNQYTKHKDEALGFFNLAILVRLIS